MSNNYTSFLYIYLKCSLCLDPVTFYSYIVFALPLIICFIFKVLLLLFSFLPFGFSDHIYFQVFIIISFFLNFYGYSITVVCLFSPSLHPTPAEPTSDFSMSSIVFASNLHICWDTIGCSLCSSEDHLGVPSGHRKNWAPLPPTSPPSSDLLFLK